MAELHVPTHPVRFVTAASLFDGHDAAINIMRRILQRQGAEVDPPRPQPLRGRGGHRGRPGGRAGRRDQLVPGRARRVLHLPRRPAARAGRRARQGLRRGRRRDRAAGDRAAALARRLPHLLPRGRPAARPARDDQHDDPRVRRRPRRHAARVVRRAVHRASRPPSPGRSPSPRPAGCPTGSTSRRGAPCPCWASPAPAAPGKSSLTDELVRRFRLDQEDKLRIAVLAVDPTRRRGGGALLGDRIRMNSLGGDQVFFRSMATRGTESGLPERLGDVIAVLKAAGFDLVIVETPGIGQGDAGIVPFVDRSLYVMTPEFGAASPAREDRHARLRRRRGDQQVRAPGRRRRPPRRGPPARAQPRGVRRELGGHAGLRHQRRHVQRRRRDRALPAPEGAARRERAHRRRRASPAHRPQDLQRLRGRHPAAAGAVPGGDRRDRPRLPRGHRRARRRRPDAPAPAHGATSWSASPSPRPWNGPRRRSRRSRPRCSTSGRRSSRPTPATRWSCASATRSCGPS